jgi:RNA polymerase sigma-70 factor (ECF subfamily)
MIAISAPKTGISTSNPRDPNGKSLDPRPDNQSAASTEITPALATNHAEKTMSSSGLDEHRLSSPETWLDEHGDALYRYALLRLRDPHRAEDVVQETLLAALVARERFSGAASVRTWLIGILKHKVMDQFRLQVREVPLDDPAQAPERDDPTDDGDFVPSGSWRERLSDWGNPEEMAGRGEFIAFLQRCLDGLPRRLAQLYWLREVMEEDTETICEEMSITPNNLWTMLHRARLGLRRCLDRTWLNGLGHGGK